MISHSPELFGLEPAKLLELLFDRLPVGTAVIDRDFILRRCNPTWAEFIDCYTPSSTADVVPGVSIFDLEPGTEEVLKPLFAPVFAGQTVRQEGLRLESGGIVSYWDVVLVPLEVNGQVVAALDVSLDATSHVLSQQKLEAALANLEEEVAARTQEIAVRHQELEALYRADEQLLQHLELENVLQSLVDVAVEVLQADKSSLMAWDEDHERLVVCAAHGFQPQTLARMSFAPGEGTVGRVAITGETAVVEDTHQDERVLTAITELESIRSFMHFPIMVNGEVFGVFNVDYTAPRTFNPEEQRLFAALTQRAALAIENAQLYREERKRHRESERRRQVAESLRGIVRVLNSDQPLPQILDYIVAQASQLMGAAIGTLHHIDHAAAFVRIEASHGLPDSLRDISGFPLLSSQADQLILAGQPVAITDKSLKPLNPPQEERLDPQVRRWRQKLEDAYRAYLAVPLIVANEVYGSLAFYFAEARPFSQETIDLATSLAEQAALAIDNASLREQAERAAVVSERDRLARELHDAVTQTLFSASLIADVLPRLWQRDPELGEEKLVELRELTRGALAEMRTLLLELRPATLTESSLEELLRQLADAVSGRSRLLVSVHIEGQLALPPDIQVALYRIAQESLNNATKHAGATAVQIQLLFQPGYVELKISDDGRGFDPASVGAHSLGLGIMRERAARINAQLRIDSVIGEGTTIAVRVPLPGPGAAKKETANHQEEAL